MARDTQSITKMSRREGYALHPKALKYMVKRSTIPGQHGRNNRRTTTSQYSLQRQLVSHGHFTLNGRRIDIPSIRLSSGDVLVVRDRSKQTEYFKKLDDITGNVEPSVSWVKANRKKFEITVVGEPSRAEAEPEINEQLIVEYYSR